MHQSISEQKKTKAYSNLLVRTVDTNSRQSRRRETLVDWIMIDEKELLGERKVEGNLGDQNH